MRPATTISMLIFAALGLLWTVVYWDGLVAWYRFCSLPYDQVKGTDYEDMWTSLRGASGVLFLIMVLVWLLTCWRCSVDSKNSSNQTLQATAASPGS